MPRRWRLAIRALGPLLLLASAVAPAQAGLVATVTGVVTPEAGGIYLYDYTVTVDPTSTSAVSEFDLNISSGTTSGIITPVGAPLSSITMPTGFINLYTLGDPTISFFSTAASTDIQPGTSEMFSFTSISGPGVMQAFQLSTLDGSGSTPVGGSVIGPTSVPEPSSLVLSGLGILGLIASCAHGRTRKHTA